VINLFRFQPFGKAPDSSGEPIGTNDLLIAAHARALDLAPVTAYSSEFSRLPELRVENWLG
jgi:tRNA(fMet)-specific endonuclease VapC